MPFRISFDRERCQGHGRCYALAPEVYSADDDGYCVPLTTELSDAQIEAARLGAMNCPEDALVVTE